MKRSLILVISILAIFMAFADLSSAQTKVELGIKGVLNVANLTGDVSNNEAMVGFGGGGLMRITPSPQLCIQPEVLWMMKGMKEKGGDNEKMKLSYIEIPVLVIYKPPTSGNIKPSFFVGPAVSFLLGAKIGEEDFKEYVNSTDFGLVLGGGVNFETAAKSVVYIDVRYTLGLGNIAKDSGEDSVKNGVFSLGVSYLFPVGK